MSDSRVRPLRDEVREAVLEAAHVCFVEHGYRRVTVEQIARRAGYSKGAVYSNFESKSDLFLSLLVEVEVTQAIAIMDMVGAGSDDDLPQVLRRAAEGIVAVSQLPVAGLLVAEFESEAYRDPAMAQRLATVRDDVNARLVAYLVPALAALGVSLTRPASEVVTLLGGLVSGLALESVGAEGPVVSVEAVEALLVPLLRVEPR